MASRALGLEALCSPLAVGWSLAWQPTLQGPQRNLSVLLLGRGVSGGERPGPRLCGASTISTPGDSSCWSCRTWCLPLTARAGTEDGRWGALRSSGLNFLGRPASLPHQGCPGRVEA